MSSSQGHSPNLDSRKWNSQGKKSSSSSCSLLRSVAILNGDLLTTRSVDSRFRGSFGWLSTILFRTFNIVCTMFPSLGKVLPVLSLHFLLLGEIMLDRLQDGWICSTPAIGHVIQITHIRARDGTATACLAVD